jgi:hypothetical protein
LDIAGRSPDAAIIGIGAISCIAILVICQRQPELCTIGRKGIVLIDTASTGRAREQTKRTRWLLLIVDIV